MKLKKRNKVLALALLVFIAAGGYFAYTTLKEQKEASMLAIEEVSRPELSFAFSYESGHNGLALFEPEISGEPLKAAYILMPATDFVEVRNGDDGSTPATISMFVFTKPEEPEDSELSRTEELLQWATDNQQLTGINLAEDAPEETEIDGVKAVMYETDGSYNQTVYLVSYRNNIYMFVGQYENRGDKIREDFEKVIEAVVFE